MYLDTGQPLRSLSHDHFFQKYDCLEGETTSRVIWSRRLDSPAGGIVCAASGWPNGITSTAPVSLTGSRGEYFVGLLESIVMVEQIGRYL